jgi:hypothetical protein
MRVTRLVILAGIVGARFALAAGAQTSTGFVRVTARDSTGAPVPQAELVVTKGLKDVVARGTTDDAGRALLGVPVRDSTDLQVTMRKIGYRRGDFFFGVGPRDTASVTIVVGRPVAGLAPVVVTSEASLKYKSYHLDADQIEAAGDVVDNGWEVVKRLRPDMLTSRGGCTTGVQEVWVNGKRIRLPLMPTGMVAARARVGAPPRARFSYVAVSVLSEIAPEHIQEILYHDCFDATMAAVGSTNAIFVILKPGVTYVQDVGSFVVEQATQQKRP